MCLYKQAHKNTYAWKRKKNVGSVRDSESDVMNRYIIVAGGKLYKHLVKKNIKITIAAG